MGGTQLTYNLTFERKKKKFEKLKANICRIIIYMWTQVKNQPTGQQNINDALWWEEEIGCLHTCDRKRRATWRKKSDGQTCSQPIICLFEETSIKLRH